MAYQLHPYLVGLPTLKISSYFSLLAYAFLLYVDEPTLQWFGFRLKVHCWDFYKGHSSCFSSLSFASLSSRFYGPPSLFSSVFFLQLFYSQFLVMMILCLMSLCAVIHAIFANPLATIATTSRLLVLTYMLMLECVFLDSAPLSFLPLYCHFLVFDSFSRPLS